MFEGGNEPRSQAQNVRDDLGNGGSVHWRRQNPEEKQSRLTAACSAWNMACGSPEDRQRHLEQYVEGYQRFNPATSPSDLAGIRCDMESLIGRKVELFPLDQRQIVNANDVMVGDDYRIEIASARVQ
jgi:hypothetical protein